MDAKKARRLLQPKARKFRSTSRRHKILHIPVAGEKTHGKSLTQADYNLRADAGILQAYSKGHGYIGGAGKSRETQDTVSANMASIAIGAASSQH